MVQGEPQTGVGEADGQSGQSDSGSIQGPESSPDRKQVFLVARVSPWASTRGRKPNMARVQSSKTIRSPGPGPNSDHAWYPSAFWVGPPALRWAPPHYSLSSEPRPDRKPGYADADRLSFDLLTHQIQGALPLGGPVATAPCEPDSVGSPPRLNQEWPVPTPRNTRSRYAGAPSAPIRKQFCTRRYVRGAPLTCTPKPSGTRARNSDEEVTVFGDPSHPHTSTAPVAAGAVLEVWYPRRGVSRHRTAPV